MLYPLKFAPVYKEIIWGGTGIKKYFGREGGPDKIAESWELTCRGDGMGVVSNGPLAGRSFESLIEEYKASLLGKRVVLKYGLSFPLLVKLIDANDRLSVQVHPDDAGARLEGEPNGKNEMWYIIDAKEDAKLICGLKNGTTRQEFIGAVKNGGMSSILREVSVKAGDCLFIEAGTVHAILDGVLIAEIQQNSNTTYRIYDWGRVDADGKGRELHIDKALKAIDFNKSPAVNASVKSEVFKGYESRELLRSEFFNLDEITVGSEYTFTLNGGSFIAITVLSGSGELTCNGGRIPVTGGESLLIPASLDNVKVSGSLKFLQSGI